MNTWATHQIQNQFDELQDYNLFDTDPILQEILPVSYTHLTLPTNREV